MPCKIKVKVLAGRNLPVMDRAGDTTDAFVEIKFAGITQKTDVCRKSLNPHWNSAEWYRFEVDESELQDEPLQLRLMDHDTYSANDAIGKVVISLAPLLAKEANTTKGNAALQGGAVMSGWIPVFDTMHGIRGELNIIVKVDLFSDFNKYKTSSCGVQFFHCPTIPPGYRLTGIHGFVEELVVNDDPEYQWIDKIRTPRASNEARQVAFIKLSNQVQRLVGLKAAELGANAVMGYQQDFDLEGEAGVVARAIGTAVSITPLPTPSQPLNIPPCTQHEDITDLNVYFQSHQDELSKLLNVLNPRTTSLFDEQDNDEDDEKGGDFTRQSSIKTYKDNTSLYQDEYASHKSLRHLSEDQTDLNKLLSRKNEDEDSDSSGPISAIKKIKTSIMSRKFPSIRSRKSDKNDDQISLKSNTSDISRISLSDIKNEFKKLKRLKKPKVKNTFVNIEDEGVGMASILARSVIHAHTSLACIAETQDSEASPASTMRRPSGSEPTLSLSDEDSTRKDSEPTTDKDDPQNEIKEKTSENRSKSLRNLTSENPLEPHRSLSESCPSTPIAARVDNLLKPGEDGYFGSASSALSGESSELYSTSEGDDEESNSDHLVETTSSVVQTVINKAVNPKIVEQMERKLSVFDETPTINLSEYAEKENIKEIAKESTEPETDDANIKPTQADPEKPPNKDDRKPSKAMPTLHFNFHNPFSHKKVSKSLSAPSSPVEKDSFVYRSSRRIKRQLSKISKSSMIESLLHKKKNTIKNEMAYSNSGSDVSKTPSHETVLGSPFLSYSDLLSLDKEYDINELIKKPKDIESPSSPIKMYIGSEPVSRTSFSGPSSLYEENHGFERKVIHKKEKLTLKPTGLVHSAMETILMDKVQSLMVPTSPNNEGGPPSDKKFFDDVSQKLEEHHKAVKNENLKNQKHREKMPESESSGLIQTAMKTMLIDKVQSLLPPESSEQNATDSGLRHLDNTEHHEVSKHHHMQKQSHDDHPKTSEPTGLIHTAMQTMLIDKVQSLIPTEHVSEQETRYVPESENIEDAKHEVLKNENSPQQSDVKETRVPATPSLFQSAMQTMLIDKVQSLLNPVSPDTVSEEKKFVVDDNDHLKSIPQDESTSNDDESGDKKKLVRQHSIHDESTDQSLKMSKEIDANITPCKPRSAPMLQHFHPLLSGPNLETIPSLPESQTESLDADGLERGCDSNQASVCDNLHAACGVDRGHGDKSERDREREKDKGSPRHARHESYGGKEPGAQAPANISVNAASTPVGIHRRSSDSDLSVTPKGGSLNTSAGNAGSGGGAILRPSMNSNNLDMLEYPFLTLTEYPPGFIVHIGGTVCARSVKLVHSIEEATCRASWWAELRTELRAHARALRCNAVIKYSDSAVMCEDVCILSASGTAAVINLDCDFNTDGENTTVTATASKETSLIEEEKSLLECSAAHVPYSPGAGPYRAELALCGVCRRARVPAVLLSTCAKPKQLLSYGKTIHITAVACRIRRAPPTSEPGARDISDQLPFLEYELHKLLLAKLRMQGANALFGVWSRVSCGARCVAGAAGGAAVRLAALPPPKPPTVTSSENEKEALELQKKLWETFQANKIANGYDVQVEQVSNGVSDLTDDAPALDLCADRDACLLELDDADDVETAKSLAVRRTHMQLYDPSLKVSNAPPYAFAQVCRGRVTCSSSAAAVCARALDTVAYKLRRLSPYVVAAPVINMDLPDDEIQLMVSGTAIPLADPSKSDVTDSSSVHDDDELFTLDEEQPVKSDGDDKFSTQQPASVRLSSAPLIPNVGERSVRGVCALKLLFVRETTAVRELGGLSGFLHTFTCEVLAIVRAHTAALGGNTLASFYITQLMLQDNAHKNQGQCLLAVGGDVVHVTY